MSAKIFVITMLLFAVLSCARQDPGELAAASRETTVEFMQTLKATLQQAMQEGGPVNAVAVCNTRAPAIAADISRQQGREVARTSLKVRNPANAADDWERGVLLDFEARKSRGEDLATLEHYEIVSRDGGKVFRYMKAIPTAEICLVCHGETLEATLGEKISELYPQDQATGYKPGDIRGAFTITQPL